MSSNQDVVATSFAISQKEQALKTRFFNNQSAVPQKTQIVTPPDPKLNSFLDDMQKTLQKETTGTVTGELLRKHAYIMQEQVEIIKENQNNMREIIGHVVNRPNDSQDPRRMMAELLAPLNKQILDVKNYYEETKSTAREIADQVINLKQAISQKKNPADLKKSVEVSMSKFNNQKTQFQNKVKETENMVKDVMENTQERLLTDGCKKGIDYLCQQIQAVKTDTEQVEIELQNRYKRIMEQCLTIKNLPNELISHGRDYKSALQRIQERLGGCFDYEDTLDQIERSIAYKNSLILEFKQDIPVYPKLKREGFVENNGNFVEKQGLKKKQIAMHPVPLGGKRTFTVKPVNLTNLPSQPLKTPAPIPKPKSQSFIKSTSKIAIKPKEEPPKPFVPPVLITKSSVEMQTETPKAIQRPVEGVSKSDQT